ncbi:MULTISPECIES: hypothetical protein [Pseudomonas]|uniref:hypothetical protein n=1 Tax=Pseudomonas TaxID=286 RepID=UPI000CFF5CF7|nr:MULTISPECIES: hypothetical protein [Pseudomonas]PRA54706.1 hypothetical protein CQZ98_11185 [Pseudomonas sp. MYb115]QXN49710.1 hypothetical protein KW062_26205 [Pseudomonas fluorescens]WSO24024.1 hypothetical protein VUJ50_26365 [Pseudomonas fluorescens]
MAKHLTKVDIEKILHALDGWEGRLTWEALCDSMPPLIGTRPTRQTLSAHLKIQEAFQHKKGRRDLSVGAKVPVSLSLAAQRIKRLEEENARLRNENEGLLEQFVVWQYNAYCHGLTEQQLAAPLPRARRGSSES